MTLSHELENKRMARMAQKGFSLIEVMLAIMIGAIIIGGTLYFATTYFEIAKRKSTNSTLQNLNIVLLNFKNEKRSYTESLTEIKKSGFWKGKDIPKDGWDRPFKYSETPDGKHPYELFSYGPEGKGGPKEGRISIWDK